MFLWGSSALFSYVGMVTLLTVSACGNSEDEKESFRDASVSQNGENEIDNNSPTPLGDMVSDPRMKGMLEAHNDVRASVQPKPDLALRPLNWSEKLAADAAAWAAKCIQAHDPAIEGLNQGENWRSWSAANALTAREVVENGWASDERENYDYASNTCDGGHPLGCGHYTQVVWRDTEEVGCAVQVCPEGLEYWPGGREIWFCRYFPPGNWAGEKPY